MAYKNDKPSVKDAGRNFRFSDRMYLILYVFTYGIIILAFIVLSSILMQTAWTTYDMMRFYSIAEAIVQGSIPYLDCQDPKPPLIFFTLTLPVILGIKYLGGLLMVGICNLISATLVMKIGWNLYGRFAGFMAGLLFTMNIAWAQGYFILTEPFALTFILASTYLLMFKDGHLNIMASGIFAGTAVGFKQYALLIVPLAAYYLYRKGKLHDMTGFIIGFSIPLLIIFGAIFAIYGSEAGNASIYWSFGVAGTYLTQSDMGDVTSYRASDPLILAANIILAISALTSVLALAVANYVKEKDRGVCEDYFLVCALAFSSTILIRQYLHYWILALPFIVLLVSMLYRERDN